jgi:Cu+-exporting ATPase
MAIGKSLSWGAVAFALMLAIFFGVVSLVSGQAFALDQFSEFRYFIIALALGFGVQVGLYTTLRQLVGQQKHRAR